MGDDGRGEEEEVAGPEADDELGLVEDELPPGGSIEGAIDERARDAAAVILAVPVGPTDGSRPEIAGAGCPGDALERWAEVRLAVLFDLGLAKGSLHAGA